MIVAALALALLSIITLMFYYVKSRIEIGELKEKLDKHQIESLDSIKLINSYTGVGTKGFMPSPLILTINHMCDTEYKRLQSLYNKDN